MPLQLFRTACFFTWVALIARTAFAADATPLVKVYLKGGKSVVGELMEQTAKDIKVRELKTGNEQTYLLDDVSKVGRDLADKDAISAAGLPAFVAWKLSHDQASAVGKIADVKPTAIYVTLGTKSGARKGQKLFAYRDEGEIKDPDTGEVLERQRAKIAEIEITEAREKNQQGEIARRP